MLMPNSLGSLAVGESRSRCRACANSGLETVLDLGSTPLANAFLTETQANQPETCFPLRLVFCTDCSLVQITETVRPEILFKDYLYFTSFSETMVCHARDIAHRMIRSRKLGTASLVVEIASNDGYLLQHYQRAGVPVLGIEPAENVAKVAREKQGIPTLCGFFDLSLAQRLSEEKGEADVIHANNVLAHVADLHGFLAGLRTLMKDGGIAVIEVPYVKDLIDRVEFDTIYHEHLSYFSMTTLDSLCRSEGLAITDVERLEIHGGSLRIFVQKAGESTRPSRAVEPLLEEERNWGAGELTFYRDFASKVQILKEDLLRILQRLKAEGARLAAYGASAKGSTLLNSFRIDQTLLDFVVDRNTAKQGLFTPGAHLPVYAPAKLLEAMPQYCLLLTWNFADEILKQQAEYQRRGGRFVIPLPEPRLADA